MTDEQHVSDKLTVTEYATLVTLIAGMLAAMETRIIERLADNSRIAAERWARHDVESSRVWERHDAEAARVMVDWDARFGRLEQSVSDHHHAAEMEHVTWDARINPLRNSAALVAKNWRTILLAFFALLGFVAIAADVVARYLGLPA